eukprot:6215126-Prymnesium_polylepis.1
MLRLLSRPVRLSIDRVSLKLRVQSRQRTDSEALAMAAAVRLGAVVDALQERVAEKAARTSGTAASLGTSLLQGLVRRVAQASRANRASHWHSTAGTIPPAVPCVPRLLVLEDVHICAWHDCEEAVGGDGIDGESVSPSSTGKASNHDRPARACRGQGSAGSRQQSRSWSASDARLRWTAGVHLGLLRVRTATATWQTGQSAESDDLIHKVVELRSFGIYCEPCGPDGLPGMPQDGEAAVGAAAASGAGVTATGAGSSASAGASNTSLPDPTALLQRAQAQALEGATVGGLLGLRLPQAELQHQWWLESAPDAAQPSGLRGGAHRWLLAPLTMCLR